MFAGKGGYTHYDLAQGVCFSGVLLIYGHHLTEREIIVFAKAHTPLESHMRYYSSTMFTKRSGRFPERASHYPCVIPGHFLVHHSQDV